MKQTIFRMHLLRILSALIVLVLVYNLFEIQVVEGEHWRNVSENNRFRHLVQTAPRGKIITADGVELADNIPAYNVALAHEPDSDRRNETIEVLSSIIDMPVEDIVERVAGHSRRFEPVVVARDIDFETVLLLEENRHRMPALVIQVTPKRVYPQEMLLAHALGRTNIDYTGTEGLELQWDEYLTGQDGLSVVQVNATARPVGAPVYSQPAVPGHNLHLTIDAGLQQAAQDSLQRVIEFNREERGAHQAYSGSVVVMDVNTGQILAMVSEPTFDANKKHETSLWDSENRYLINRAVGYRRPIGSTFKMITGLAALEENKATATETIRCTGRTSILSFPTVCYNSVAHGHLSMRGALDRSCNIYFGTMGVRLGYEMIYEYAEMFGLTREVRNAGFTDLPQGEQQTSLDFRRAQDSWWGGDTVQISYGQLNEFTPLQVANYVTMLANGGIHYKPYMVEQIVDANGETVEEFAPEVLAEYAFAPENMLVIHEGMRAAARSTASLRGLPFDVAGKTGTAQDGRKGYDSHSWWVGFAPYDEPEIAIVAFMEHGVLGSRSAEIGRDIIDYYFGLIEEENEDE
ncbi:MAG: hypothetical protein FH749_09000 [Firmicutes bacterium]|nr:hypothetical protein [Bacillota bacterium]